MIIATDMTVRRHWTRICPPSHFAARLGIRLTSKRARNSAKPDPFHQGIFPCRTAQTIRIAIRWPIRVPCSIILSIKADLQKACVSDAVISGGNRMCSRIRGPLQRMNMCSPWPLGAGPVQTIEAIDPIESEGAITYPINPSMMPKPPVMISAANL